MKALAFYGTRDLRMEERAIPVPAEDEILVRTRAATICTSDINDLKYNTFGLPVSTIMGHEGSGDVVSVGSKVQNIQPGDRVTAHPVMPCGKCDSCRRGLPHLCDDMTHLGLNKGGVFAEYFCIRANRVRKIPEGMDYALASLMEPVCVCLEAVERAAVQPGGNVLILGDGPFGILTAKLVQSRRPGCVVVTGRHDFRLKHATHAVGINEKAAPDIQEAILAASGGEGMDSAILCAGNAQAVNTAIQCLRARGTLAIFSVVSPMPDIDLFRVHVKELNLCGCCNDNDYLDQAIQLLADPALRLEEVITHRLPFAEWERAFHLAEFGKDEALKVTLTFD